ncbi:MAG: hypothetical protein Q9160_000964 [Pyrenula sp. 1 TL-2023]
MPLTFLPLPLLLTFRFLLQTLLLNVSPTISREVTFPPIAAVRPNGQSFQQTFLGAEEDDDDILAEVSGVAGLPTFANLPYVECMSKKEEGVDPYDIAVLGAPFDTGVTARPGARYGPHGIRDGSRRIAPAFSWSVYTHSNPFASWARIVDCGDAPLTFLDNTVALKQLERAHKLISGREANATSISRVPRILTLGGDHTTTLPALRAVYEHWGREPVSVIHFDSHLDTWNPEVLGGGVSRYAGVNHGTFLHIAHEEGLISNDSSVHAGIRAPYTEGKKGRNDLKEDRMCGFDIVTARDLDRIGAMGIIDKLKARVGDSKVYISVDIDVLDPAYAPGTMETALSRK